MSALRDWLEAADPGALRRHHAARTALASLSAWLIAHYTVPWLAGRPMPQVGLFAVTICFIDALVIVDAPRHQRRVTLLLSLGVFAAALLLACLFNSGGIAFRAVLLALIFLSYYMRRRGLRAGELALVLTMGLYFAQGSGASWKHLPLFLFAAVTGVLCLWLWQFVLLPYDPRRALRDSVRAFYGRAADLVGEVQEGLAGGGRTLPEAGLKRHMRRAKLSRRVIESQFPGVLAPGGWTEDEIGKMQLALYAAERGLGQMVEGVIQSAALAAAPPEVCESIRRSLALLQEALRDDGNERVQALVADGLGLQNRVRSFARRASAELDAGEGEQLALWVPPAVRLAGGTYEVARSAVIVRRLAAHESPDSVKAEVPAGAGPAKRAAAPALVSFGNRHVHPTTALGIQAVVATGLAMLVARLLDVDHSTWVFWTAFVVIAGSTGESLRKMMLRVVSTTGGAAIGVALALLLPQSTALIVTVATVCIFLTIYFWPISYPLMVFWINIGFVIVYTRLGALALDLLLARPLTTLIGGLVAALVVVFVFPIRTGSRFRAAAAQFLAAVDGYVAAFVGLTGKDDETTALDAAQARVSAAYAQVERMLPSVAFENNPLMQAQSSWALPATQLAALEAEVTRLAGATEERAILTQDAPGLAWMRNVQARIHRDVQALILVLRSDRGREPQAEAARPGASALPAARPQRDRRPAADLPADTGQGPLATGGGMPLLRIQDTIAQLVAQLGASAVQAPE